jgi:hypothetical protein
VRKNCTPGSVRGASGNWRPYRDGAEVEVHRESHKGKNVEVCMSTTAIWLVRKTDLSLSSPSD